MNNPVQNITWYEAVLFANLLSDERGLTSCYYKDASFSQAVTIENYNGGDFYWKQDANGYRLLSESEWEYSCRAGASGPFWIQELNYNDHNCDLHCTPGMMPSLESVAWFSGNKMSPEGLDTTKPVGMKLPNPWGLYDVHGNVDELCWDCFDPYPPMNDYENMDGTISSGCDKVGRGGCWGSDPYMCRSAARNGMPPDAREPALGFRLARSLP